jgi:hypothetical protein
VTVPPRALSVESLDAAIGLLALNGRRAILPMIGESMRPTLAPGERVLVEFDPTRLERGDLVLYRQLDYLVVHRVLGPASRENDPALRTRGDGTSALDPPLERSRVRGRVTAIERDGAWFLLDGEGARAFALAVAVHDLAWAGVHAVLVRVGLGALAAACDRALLGLAHRALFRALHRRSAGLPA